jgi:GTP cyclohydrolase I
MKDGKIDGEKLKRLVVEWIQCVGEDPNRPGLVETPRRVVGAWRELLNGYGPEPKLITFPNDNGYDQLIVSSGIEFSSTCEHHLLPFWGFVTIGYLPGSKIMDEIAGLSKFDRIVDYFAHRLQNQERMTKDIADFLDDRLKPRGVMVIVYGRHMCKEMRGVRKRNSTMITSSVKGEFLKDPDLKMEFLQLTRGNGQVHW